MHWQNSFSYEVVQPIPPKNNFRLLWCANWDFKVVFFFYFQNSPNTTFKALSVEIKLLALASRSCPYFLLEINSYPYLTYMLLFILGSIDN